MSTHLRNGSCKRIKEYATRRLVKSEPEYDRALERHDIQQLMGVDELTALSFMRKFGHKVGKSRAVSLSEYERIIDSEEFLWWRRMRESRKKK